MARAWLGRPRLKLPTAQALLADQARTAFSWLLVPGLGLATRVHLVPFQRRMRVLVPAGPLVELPTAHALPADVTATPLRELSCAGPPGLGLATRVHLAPFQCRMRVCCTPVPGK